MCGKVSIVHTVSYSIIALQEAALNVLYPSIFWAAARLLVESSSIRFMEEDLELLKDEADEEDEKETKDKTVNYFKMSSAIGEIRSFGVNVLPPDINRSSFSFKPVVAENAIYFGLKGLTRIGNNVIREILQNRPYQTPADLWEKVSLNKIQATMLIKAGALDSFGDRDTILRQYCEQEADKKKTLNLRNAQMLIENNFVSSELKFESDLFRFNKHIRKNFLYGDRFVLDNETSIFLSHFGFTQVDILEGTEFFLEKDWKKFYDKNMIPLKEWIKENEDRLLEEVNQAAVQVLLDKYAKGNLASREMEALSYYYTYHELEAPEYQEWLGKLGISNFFDLPEEPEVEAIVHGRKIFKLHRIVGTSIGRDKQKHIAGISTMQGLVKAKFYRSQFLKYDKQIKLDGETESSWFLKGNILLLSGYRSGDQFIVKTYKNHRFGQPIYKVENPGLLVSERIGD